MSVRKILIDTDPGVDDAMAIFYALASPELDVVGLTTIFGNADTATCTRNALRLLEIAERTDIGVARGAAKPLAMDFRGPADFVHGTDGQGNVHLPDASTATLGIDASRFIIDTVMAAPGEITLVPMGPLTNVAMALILEPDLPRHLAGIVLMGGAAFVGGNASPAAEANILNDPEAADLVFGADCPIVMCGLDVTERTVMTTATLGRFDAMTNAPARHIARILPFYRDFYRDRSVLDGIYVHDSSVISYLLAPQHFTTATHPVRVDTAHGIGRGKTWAARNVSDHESAWSGRRAVTICTGVDSEAVVELELARLA